MKMFLMDNKLGTWLQQKREEKGLKQIELAAKSRLDRSVISKIENGQTKKPSVDTLRAIAKGLEIPEEEILNVAGYQRKIAKEDLAMAAFSDLISKLTDDEVSDVLDFGWHKLNRRLQLEARKKLHQKRDSDQK